MNKSLVEVLDIVSNRLANIHTEIEREALCTEDPRVPENLKDVADALQKCIDDLDTIRDATSDVTVAFAQFVEDVKGALR